MISRIVEWCTRHTWFVLIGALALGIAGEISRRTLSRDAVPDLSDPQIGLVDFYGRVGEKLVWLCWRYGEDTLGYYHDLETGFPSRRPLTAEVRRHLLN